MNHEYVNLACGSSYIPRWSNLDYSDCPPWVQHCNLLGPLPISTGSCRFVYSSHYLEHIPTQRVSFFLEEVYRILRPGGIVRIVTPDFSEMCLAYASAYQAGDTDTANFIQLEILDQCVRKIPGGELGKLYKTLATKGPSNPQERIRRIIYHRTGETLLSYAESRLSKRQELKELLKSQKVAFHKIVRQLRVRLACLVAPSAFVEQNISQAAIGENHAWLYTFDQLANLLSDAGFTNPERVSFNTSNLAEFPYSQLDMHPDGAPRKGAESMYVEAIKPL